MGLLLWALFALLVAGGALFLIVFLPVIGVVLALLLLVALLGAAGAIGAFAAKGKARGPTG